ncbi:hypothetical protein GWO60_01620 [Corynebacterium macginleyi]|uniref:hypothetical protein n=1 Tax=Corynebacterium macginleyi TaxID=38290 RepID=UPI00190DE8CA|nr:hypothetical protein [Corynebacterium macginleyi]MBK4173310.1 hypothetical protein [Corynebacterium macginleyi]
MSLSDFSQLTPGVTIACRDEHWLVSNVTRTTDGFRIRARGVSDYVRDTTATFFTALDDSTVFNPANVTVAPDELRIFGTLACGWSRRCAARRCRCTKNSWRWPRRCWRTPLDYQLSAVKSALSDEHL